MYMLPSNSDCIAPSIATLGSAGHRGPIQLQATKSMETLMASGVIDHSGSPQTLDFD